MKKLLTLGLILSFTFSVSAASVHTKSTEKEKIEKSVLNSDYSAVVSVNCEQTKVLIIKTPEKEFYEVTKTNFNFKEILPQEYIVDASRCGQKKYKIPS